MRKYSLTALVTCASLAATCMANAAPSSLAKNVSPWVATAPKLGAADERARVTVQLFLGFRNQDDLKELIKAETTPGSESFGKYLTPEAFRLRFAPPAADVARVEATLRRLGFAIEHVPASGLYVEASGTVGQVKNAFHVSQQLYGYKGKVLRANAEAPRIPAEIADVVTYVAGLDDSGRLLKPDHVTLDRTAVSPLGHAGSAAPPPVAGGIGPAFCSTYWGDHTATLSTKPGLYPQTLPWQLCGYTPPLLQQAYGADKVTEDGTGVRVAIVDLYGSPTITADANHYSKNHGLPKLTYLNFEQILPPGITHVPASDPCGPQGWYEEESLDVEAVHSMAPGAFILFVGEKCTDPGNTGLYDIIDNHLADIVTNSYSYGGESLPAGFIEMEEAYFMQAAAEGISVLFSSGDDGDLAAANGIASGTWEATSPYVTGVGGTSLGLRDSSGKKFEWGWGDYRAFLGSVTVSSDGKSIATTGLAGPFSYYAGSGGGVSLVELAPDYQVDVPYTYSGYTHLANGTLVPLEAPHRVTPDISMVGDPYTGFLYGETFTIAGNPVSDAPCVALTATTEYCETVIGGTSLASPLFAGVLARVDQARFANGKSSIGLVNTALYGLPVGPPGSSTAPIIDVEHPSTPTALLRGYLGNPNEARVVTMVSVPNGAGTAVHEGWDTSLRSVAGYDTATGLGVPNVPALIDALGSL